jgi:thiamine pyrophosphokinase
MDRTWLFQPTPASRASSVAVFLNVPVAASVASLAWRAAGYRIAADGASNRLLAQSPPLLPDVVCGDLDSATPETLAACRRAGTQVVHVADQDTTDLWKCLGVVRDLQGVLGTPLDVVLVGGGSGRLDHAVQNLNALYVTPPPLNQKRCAPFPLPHPTPQHPSCCIV